MTGTRLAALLGPALLLVGCEPWKPVSDTTWKVGDCEVREMIEESKNNWPDPVFQRTYWLVRDRKKVLVGRYQNESSLGVIGRPYAVGEYIVIPSSSKVIRIGPDNRVTSFSPWEAGDWDEFAEPRGINGHYDYEAARVQRTAAGWELTYRLQKGLAGNRPDELRFVTGDDWKSFRVVDHEGKGRLKP